MLFEELMKEEYNAGKADALAEATESILELLREIAPVSENLKNRIQSITVFEDVMQLMAQAAKADSLQAFEKELEKMGY